jgi:hypothetical protein
MRMKECFGFDLARVSNLTMAQGERRTGDPLIGTSVLQVCGKTNKGGCSGF